MHPVGCDTLNYVCPQMNYSQTEADENNEVTLSQLGLSIVANSDPDAFKHYTKLYI